MTFYIGDYFWTAVFSGFLAISSYQLFTLDTKAGDFLKAMTKEKYDEETVLIDLMDNMNEEQIKDKVQDVKQKSEEQNEKEEN